MIKLNIATCTFWCNILGQVVWKPVNNNPGLKVNWSINFPCIKMFFTTCVLCSLRAICYYRFIVAAVLRSADWYVIFSVQFVFCKFVSRELWTLLKTAGKMKTRNRKFKKTSLYDLKQSRVPQLKRQQYKPKTLQTEFQKWNQNSVNMGLFYVCFRLHS